MQNEVFSTLTLSSSLVIIRLAITKFINLQLVPEDSKSTKLKGLIKINEYCSSPNVLPY